MVLEWFGQQNVEGRGGAGGHMRSHNLKTLTKFDCIITKDHALARWNILALSWHHFLWRHRVASGEDRADLWPNRACGQAYRGRRRVS
jgi:hypothetical protein